MAYNVSQLPNYIDQSSKTFVVDSLFGNQTASVLRDAGSITLGLKGTSAIQLMDQDINIQTNYNCGRNPLGNVNLSQAYITVVPLMDNLNLCPKILEQKFTVQYLSKGQNYTEALFANEIVNQRSAKIAEANEILMWQGDTTISGATNLNKFDGFIKQVKASNALKVALTGATSGATVVERLQNMFLAAPSKVTSQSDAVIFVGTDVYNEYTIALTNKNIFKDPADKVMFGGAIKLVPVDGLNGTRLAFLGRLRSFQIGLDLLGEDDKAIVEYSMETRQVYIDYYFALGVTLLFPNEISYANL